MVIDNKTVKYQITKLFFYPRSALKENVLITAQVSGDYNLLLKKLLDTSAKYLYFYPAGEGVEGVEGVVQQG